MDDDAVIEGVIASALAAPAPRPSDRFHAGVMRRVARRRLSPWGAATLAAYTLASGVACGWLLRDTPFWLACGFLVASGVVVSSAGIYAARLARLHD